MRINIDKIEFEDKLSGYVKSDSDFVFTTDNINEIKHVVNGIISYAEDKIYEFSDMMRFMSVKVPKNLEEDTNYYIELTASTSNRFEYISYILSVNSDFFYIFDGKKFVKFNYLTEKDEEKTVLIDISELNLKFRKYFIKIKFKSISDPEFSKIEIKEIKSLGSVIGTFSPIKKTEYIPSPKYWKNEDREFLNDLTDILVNFSGNCYPDDSLFIGDLSLSSVYSDGKTEEISSFMVHQLDDEDQELTQNGNYFGLSGCMNRQKILGIEFEDEYHRKFLKPLILNLSGFYEQSFSYEIPQTLNYGISSKYSITENILSGDELITSITETYPLYNDKIYKEGNYIGISHKEKEAFVEIPPLKLKSAKLFNADTNEEITKINGGTTYNYYIKAVFDENENEVEIPQNKISITEARTEGFSDCVDITSSVISTIFPNDTYWGLIDIQFECGSSKFKFQKPYLLEKQIEELSSSNSSEILGIQISLGTYPGGVLEDAVGFYELQDQLFNNMPVYKGQGRYLFFWPAGWETGVFYEGSPCYVLSPAGYMDPGPQAPVDFILGQSSSPTGVFESGLVASKVFKNNS